VSIISPLNFTGASLRAITAPRFVDRFARLQFRPDSVYSRAKPLAPLLALAVSWVEMMRHAMNAATLLNETIQVRHLVIGVALALLWILVSKFKQRDRASYTPFAAEMLAVLLANCVCGFALLAAQQVWPGTPGHMSPLLLEVNLLWSYGLLLACTWVMSSQLVPFFNPPRMALMVGTGPLARSLSAYARGGHSYRITGCIDDEDLGSTASEAPRLDPYLGSIAKLEELLKNLPIETVLIALPIRSMYSTSLRVAGICEAVGVEVTYMTDVFGGGSQQSSRGSASAHVPLAVLRRRQFGMRHLVKRGLDLAVAALLLCFLAPVLAVIAIAVRLSSPGPVLFVQQRYGMHRRRFGMYKFRTMVADAEARQADLEAMNEAQGPVFKIKKDPRVTSVGGFLRKTSLDELPQLWNVMRGEMSLVGPRPLPVRDVGLFEESWLLRRFSVPAGLTCLWQVSGRSDTGVLEWIRQDLDYIDRWSLTLDFKILLNTVPAVLRGKGAS
jgi:exopolysaccharide biosynthesis polyprenyl glycosylphosphotransferase